MTSLKDRLVARFNTLRKRRPAVDHVVRMVQHYGTVNGNLQAGAVTYFAFLSFFPILALGFYGGFIQMGMGVFFLAVMVLGARYSLMDANAVKAFVIALYTLIVIAIFQYRGLIDWKVGFVMALGQTAGGWLTAHYAGRWPRANVWAHRLLVVMVLLAVAKLFGLLSW